MGSKRRAKVRDRSRFASENAKIQFSCTKTQKIPLVIVPTLPQFTRRALKRLGKKDPQKVILIDDRNSNKAA